MKLRIRVFFAPAMGRFERWVRQPTTIAGLMALAGAAASWFTGHHDIAIPAGAAALVGLVIPDNTAGRAPAEKLLIDAATAAGTGHLVTDAGQLFSDAEAVASALETKKVNGTLLPSKDSMRPPVAIA